MGSGLTHKVYVDESGTKEYEPDRKYELGRGETSLLVLGALVATRHVASAVETVVRELKRETFGTHKVEIKANWLRIERERKERFLDRYKLTEERLKRFVDDLYKLVGSLPVTLIGVCIDKKGMQEKYGHYAYPPLGVAYEILLQRVQKQMEKVNGFAHLTIDDMTGKNTAKNDHRALLENHHDDLIRDGSRLAGPRLSLDRIVGQAFTDSAVDDRVQIADLLAYNVHRQLRDHSDEWENPSGPTLPMYDYFERMSYRLAHSPNDQVKGWGVVRWPEPKSTPRWSLTR